MPMSHTKLVPVQRGHIFQDSDARAYALAVEAADGAKLERLVGKAIDDLVIGLKADSIWTPIVSSCLLAGPRTLAGALVPLKGTAPTGHAFVNADLNRETGLLGDGATKYLDSNRNNNADGQDAFHMACWQTTADTSGTVLMGCGGAVNGSSTVNNNATAIGGRCRNNAYTETAGYNVAGFVGISRAAGASFTRRGNAANATAAVASQTPLAGNIFVFATNNVSPSALFPGRLAYYSIGANLTLSTLESRISAYITAIAAAIP